jgi:hypothetical protein
MLPIPLATSCYNNTSLRGNERTNIVSTIVIVKTSRFAQQVLVPGHYHQHIAQRLSTP